MDELVPTSPYTVNIPSSKRLDYTLQELADFVVLTVFTSGRQELHQFHFQLVVFYLTLQLSNLFH